jgi:hypothetical protein
MMKQRLLVTAVALALGVPAVSALAQAYGGDSSRPTGSMTAKEDCDQLEGTARNACLKQQIDPTERAPLRSPDAASRENVPAELAYPPSGANGGAVPRDHGPQD